MGIQRSGFLPMAFTITGGLLSVLMATAGCAGTEGSAAAPTGLAMQASQIIVKFRESDFDPSRTDYLQGLARETGVTLIYVRPMSGGAHVLRVEGVVDLGSMRRVMDALAKRREVEYAEPDQRMFPMPRD